MSRCRAGRTGDSGHELRRAYGAGPLPRRVVLVFVLERALVRLGNGRCVASRGYDVEPFP